MIMAMSPLLASNPNGYDDSPLTSSFELSMAPTSQSVPHPYMRPRMIMAMSPLLASNPNGYDSSFKQGIDRSH